MGSPMKRPAPLPTKPCSCPRRCSRSSGARFRRRRRQPDAFGISTPPSPSRLRPCSATACQRSTTQELEEEDGVRVGRESTSALCVAAPGLRSRSTASPPEALVLFYTTGLTDVSHSCGVNTNTSTRKLGPLYLVYALRHTRCASCWRTSSN